LFPQTSSGLWTHGKKRTADLFYQRGRIYFNNGQHDRAIEDCLFGLELDPKHVHCYILHIYALCRSKHYDKALEICDKTISCNPRFSPAYCGKGRVYYDKKNYDEALKALDKAKEIDPKNPYIYNIYGLVYEDQGRYEEALKALNNAIKLDSKFAWPYNNRGNVYRDQGRYEEALKEYNKAIERDYLDSYPYNNRGIVYRYQGRYEEALKEHDIAIKLNLNNPHLYHCRGNVYRKQGRYEEALEDNNKAIKHDDSYAPAYYGRGNVYRDQGRYEEALEEYNKAIERDANYAPAYNGRGNVYRYQNKIKDALVNYKNAVYFYKGTDEYYKNVALRRITELEHLESNLKKPKDKAAIIIEKTQSFINEIEQNERHRTKFYSHKQPAAKYVDSHLSFTVLRKWNSFTPIIGGGFRSSKGGGYFVQSGKTGIVIDPGFNFIENFMDKEYTFKEINAVLITHAHNDHTADLDSLLTMLHKYNAELYGGDLSDPNSDIKEGSILEDVLNNFVRKQKKSQCSNVEMMKKVKDDADQRYDNDAKNITFYITSGTFKKYAGFFDLIDHSKYKVVCVDKDHYKDFSIDEIKVHVVKAKHNDIVSDNTSVGFCFEQGDFVLIYTGDTGFWGMRKTYEELLLPEMYAEKKVVLVANIGGFKRSELSYSSEDDQESYYYKNHLGRLGLAKLVEILKPQLCIISEFGEEFVGYRDKIAEIFAETYKGSLETKFLPADIGLQVKCAKDTCIQVNAIKSLRGTTQYEFTDLPYVHAVEVKENSQIYYYHHNINKEKLVAKKKAEFHRKMHNHR
jgi:tetratricopeptide (TPR) repeat protein